MIREVLYYDYIDSPLGELELCANENSLLSLLFTKTKDHELPRKETRTNSLTEKTKAQLKSYFKKEIIKFDLPLQPKGTPFQTKVWNELCKIPFGKTISYQALAKNLGDPKCIRAAASSNGKNPITIIIPCHRVIGTNGKLVGYSGDLWRKKWMLDHESSQASLF